MEGKQAPPQMQLDIMKDTTILRCDNKIVDTEKGVEYTCNGEAFDQGTTRKAALDRFECLKL